MSRFYRLEIGPETGVQSGGQPASQNSGAVFTNQLPNGRVDLGAQTVEIDVQTTALATPVGLSTVTVWGIGLKQISQASDFNGAPVTLSAGMQAGLPLATEAAGQAGVIVKGKVFQAFGNWQGTNQSLCFVLQPSDNSSGDNPVNLVLQWKKGTQLSEALKHMMATAFPGFTTTININAKLVADRDIPGCFNTLSEFASYILPVSKAIIGGTTYPGVNVTTTIDGFIIYDGLAAAQAKMIAFQDLIGQPTWLNGNTISFSTVMRADIGVGDYITFPRAAALQTITTPQSQSQVRNSSTFLGIFQIDYVRHVGNSRAPDAQSWITTFQAHPNSSGSPTSGAPA